MTATNLEALATVRRALKDYNDLSERLRKCGEAQNFPAREALAALDTISAAQVPQQPLVKLKEAFEAGRKWQREMATPQVPLPNCDVCKQPQTALGALHFSPPDANSMCKKTHICVKCEAAPQVPEGNGQRIIDGLKDAVAYAKGDKSKETSETFNAVPQVSGDVEAIAENIVDKFLGDFIYDDGHASDLQYQKDSEKLTCLVANAIAAERAKNDGYEALLRSQKARAEQFVHLLNHIHREVCSLEDFDAESLKKEIEQTIAGTEIFNDNKILHEQLATERAASDRLREALKHALDCWDGKKPDGSWVHDARKALASQPEGVK